MTTHKDFSLQQFNTFQINVKCKYFVEVESIEDILEALTKYAEEKFVILGGGSNILFTEDFDGVILFNKILGKKVIKETSEHVFIEVASGENWDEFVSYTVKQNYGGIENLTMIPGTVGAAVLQNIGAYGAEVSSSVETVKYFDLLDLSEKSLTAQECNFSYRTSIFKNEKIGKTFITSVVFKLNLNPEIDTSFGNTYGGLVDEMKKLNPGYESNVEAVSMAVRNLRTKKLADPKKFPNAGSFFKHPIVSKEKYEELAVENSSNPDFTHFEMPDGNIKLSAGWAVEYAGMKGFRHNTAGVYEKHALVLVNYDHENPESGKNLRELEEIVKARVFEKWGIVLESEVVIL